MEAVVSLATGEGLIAAACDALGVARYRIPPPGASGRPTGGITSKASLAPRAHGRRATDGARPSARATLCRPGPGGSLRHSAGRRDLSLLNPNHVPHPGRP